VYKALILSVLLFLSLVPVSAQELKTTGQQDTIFQPDPTVKPHSPKKATILSACLPGAGQIYNKKYWKLPLVYGGIGVSVYLGIRYGNDYTFWRDEYRIATDGDTATNGEYTNLLSEAAIRDNRDTFRRWMELSYISAGLIYILQIIDANVDAHLMEFDVSDDLSLRVEPKTLPVYNQRHQALGLGVTLKIK